MDAARRALLDRLAAHVPADSEEEEHLRAIVALVAKEPLCFARTTYAPGHLTGSGFVACRRTRRVLLHHHRRLGRWLQMGGHDEGELDPRATALREAREESGLADLTLLSTDILDVHVHDIPAARGEPPHLHHDLRYALVTETPDAIRRDEKESLDLRWFSLEEAAETMGEDGSRRALARLARLL